MALVGSPWVFVALYAFATVDGFFPPIPSETVVIALASLWASGGTPPLFPVILLAAAGAFTGDQIAYTIGTSAARSACFTSTARSVRPLARAVRT